MDTGTPASWNVPTLPAPAGRATARPTMGFFDFLRRLILGDASDPRGAADASDASDEAVGPAGSAQSPAAPRRGAGRVGAAAAGSAARAAPPVPLPAPSARGGASGGSKPGGRPSMPPAPAPATARAAPSQSPPQSPRVASTVPRDAGRFAPLTGRDLRNAAGKLGNAWSGAWFGRRDRIPPADDPRTLVIDRAMVGLGLVTADELASIHAVGLRMDDLRPEISIVAATARSHATAAYEQARAAIRAAKQAEAAERKRRHDEAVARRRATDILHLGRGVSSGLADRRANVEKLTAAGLPVLATPADVAEFLGVDIPRLRWLAWHSDASPVTHYVRFEVPKKSGGVRQLAAPMPRIAAAQERILRGILDLIPLHDAAHGFVRGRSTLTNARPHVGRDAVVNCDLRDFFPSISFPRVRGVFRELGYSPAAATVLALLCTEAPRREVVVDGTKLHVAAGPRALPQGACTSPALSNLVARRLDSRLAGYATRAGFTYTRYADDLTFSWKCAGDGGERALPGAPAGGAGASAAASGSPPTSAAPVPRDPAGSAPDPASARPRKCAGDGGERALPVAPPDAAGASPSPSPPAVGAPVLRDPAGSEPDPDSGVPRGPGAGTPVHTQPPAAVPPCGRLLARVRHIASEEGFELNEKKTRVQRRSTAQSVTGIVVNDRPGVPRADVRRLRAILHRARREGLAAQNRENRPNFAAWLRGSIAYVEMVQPEQGARLRGAFESLRV